MPRFSFINGGQTQLAVDARQETFADRAELDGRLPTQGIDELAMRSHLWWQMNASQHSRRKQKRVA